MIPQKNYNSKILYFVNGVTTENFMNTYKNNGRSAK